MNQRVIASLDENPEITATLQWIVWQLFNGSFADRLKMID